MGDFLFYIAIAAVIIVVVLTVSYILSNKIANLIINSNFDVRYNDNHTLKYFTVDDFEGLQAKPIEFKNINDVTLRGYVYSHEDFKNYKALMVLAHGLGAGHLQYTTEINYFAKEGYLVFAYDVTGCNLSDGEKINGLTQALIDLNSALEFIDKDPTLSKIPKVLFGHSMGAFAVSNVTELYKKDIKGIVALAPFKNEASMLYEQFASMTNMKFKKVKNLLYKKYKARFNELVDINTIDSYTNSDVPHLVISGDADNIVDIYSNFHEFRSLFEEKANYQFLEVEGRFHRPNITLEAARYDQETNEELLKYRGEYKGKVPKHVTDEFYANLDYDLLVELDLDVMSTISSFLDSCLK